MNISPSSFHNTVNKDADTDSLGRIVSVTGSQAIVLMDPFEEGMNVEDIDRPELGTLLAISTARSIVFGMVSALSVPIPSHQDTSEEIQIVEVELLGELPLDADGKPQQFRRGVAVYPCLGDRVRRAQRSELKSAYASDNEHSAVRIGCLQQDHAIPAMVAVDELLGKHFAILGTTGTGKSCSVALILRAILKRNPQAHIVLLDPHNEYSSCFGKSAELITPQDLNLPFWLMTFEETVEVLVGSQIDRKQDVEVLSELIPLAKAYYAAKNSPSGRSRLQRRATDTGIFSVDTPVPYRISDLLALLQDNIGRLDQRGALAPYKRLKSRLEAITQDPRYSFMFGNLTVQDDMSSVLSRLFRIPVDGKPITIIELTGFPSEVTNVVVSVLCRMTFDFGLWSEGYVPITLVCEEAHRYVPEDTELGFEPTKRAIARIAKEGRKYGVSLGIITQRPAELDATILSQCNTVFAMRMANEKDQEIVKAAISDAAASLLEFIPSMRDREAIAFGEGLTLPGRIQFDSLPAHALPKSGTASFSDQWRSEITNTSFIESVISRWRAASAPDSIADTKEPMDRREQPVGDETESVQSLLEEEISNASDAIERRSSSLSNDVVVDHNIQLLDDASDLQTGIRKMSPAEALEAQGSASKISIRKKVSESLSD